MARVSIVIRRFSRFLWRHTTLTFKALFVSTVMGVSFWLLADHWQTTQVEAIFRQEHLDSLEIQARRDRSSFDSYIREQEQSVRILSFTIPLVEFINEKQKEWAANSNLNKKWVLDDRPPWLPPRSIMRGLVAASYILLLDEKRQLRETFIREENLPELSRNLREEILPKLLNTDEYSHIVADADGVIYLINVSGVLGKKASAQPKAYLALVVALDEDFLSLFHTKTESGSIVALLHGETDWVFASSQPDKVLAGMSIEQLAPKYEIFGKKFLDYNFSIDVPIHFATLVPKEEITRVSNSIVVTERKQRTLSYAAFAALFFSLVYFIAKNLQHFTEKKIHAAIDQLGLKKQNVADGDQLLIMGEQFQWMIREILNTRQRDALRQQELEAANGALKNSLAVVKQTQEQLVEAEKMASLGNLVAGVAHEINTPVGSGVTAASYLKNECEKCAASFAGGTLRKSDLQAFFHDAEESTQMILQNLNRAADLVRSFKQVAVDRTHQQQRLFRPYECIQQTLLSLRPHLKKTQHKITVQCSESLEINSYPGAFSQIISNFIVNSLMHAFQEIDRGEILFQVTETEDNLVFRYSDNGCGMEEKDRVRIFEPFFTTARHRGGSGLGMHIVFNLVTQTLKGTIYCTSSLGQGTTHEIRIPWKPGTIGI